MSASVEYVSRGKASEPGELADEIAAAPSRIFRPAYVEGMEIVSLTMSVANRDLLVKALRALALSRPHQSTPEK